MGENIKTLELATQSDQVAVQSAAGADASKAVAVQGITGGKPISTSDAGPAQTITRTGFSSADASSTPVDLTAAPGASLKAVSVDLFIAVVTACTVTILTESGSAIIPAFPMAAGEKLQLTLRGYIKGATVNKKIQATTSVASAISGICNWFGEA
jgi:hypothetical protein